MSYKPGGPWLFASPTVRTVYGWESSQTPDKSLETCLLPQELYDRLPGGHEHDGTRLYYSEQEANKALQIAEMTKGV